MAERFEGGPGFITIVSLHALAANALEDGHVADAAETFERALRMAAEFSLQRATMQCLAGLASVAGARGDEGRAATLWGAVLGLERMRRDSLPERGRYEPYVAPAAERLPEAVERGRAMTLDEAVAYALAS
jgi:hypothetical protein